MIYVHKNNLLNRIKKKGGLSKRTKDFFDNFYCPMRENVENIDFSEDGAFEQFASLMNKYEQDVIDFEKKNKIKSQSKVKSSFFEEMSCYLFERHPRIISKEFDVFNKEICIGLSLDFKNNIMQDTKDVDFCIGEEVNVLVNNKKMTIIKPIIAVEVKTYTDATMFGEIRNTNSLLRRASPHARTYVLMGYNAIAEKHLVGAKYIFINEMFVLRDNENSPMKAEAFKAYYEEISSALDHYGEYNNTDSSARLINR